MRRLMGVVMLVIVLATIIGPVIEAVDAVPPLVEQCCRYGGNAGCCKLLIIWISWEEHWPPWWE